ncbi:hypothetical protein [Gloeothece verrucosa]|uniref:hypothetical protein n=1 Tax=Gloeothece verrucosa TaxID=2546359 RepID=UPI00030C7035|nr:hypothetical protein [Gloeothece verrucosa]
MKVIIRFEAGEASWMELGKRYLLNEDRTAQVKILIWLLGTNFTPWGISSIFFFCN